MSLVDSISRVLVSVGVGNLFLVIAAIIGVAGSYWVYLKKLEHKQETLRVALIYEICSMEESIRKMDASPDAAMMANPHPEVFLSDKIYEYNSDDIGLLSPAEVAAVTDFYTSASVVQEAAKNDPENAFILISNSELYNKLLKAFNELNSHVDDEYRPDNSSFEEPVETARSSKPF